MGRTADYSRQSCSIAATLEVIGDPWTLLVIRDAFHGVSRFEQWQERLGVARNVLAARLKSLVQHGVLEPRLYSERPPRNEYVLFPDEGHGFQRRDNRVTAQEAYLAFLNEHVRGAD